MQQQKDEHLALALALSQEFIQHQLVSRDVGGGGGGGGDSGGLDHGWLRSVTQPSIPTSLYTLVF